MERIEGMMPLADAAAALRVDHKRAWGWVLAGRLVGGKRGARWYVSRESVAKVRRERERERQAIAARGRGDATG